MAIVNGYCTLIELRDWVGVGDTDDDAAIEQSIEAASRQIDSYCARVFYAEGVASRSFEVGGWRADVPARRWFADGVRQHDLLSAAVVEVAAWPSSDYAELEVTDYQLWPLNSLPKTAIELRPWRAAGMVRITGTWGWPEIPAPVAQACLMQAARLFKAKDAPFGVLANPEFGMQIRTPGMEAAVKALLHDYRLTALVA